VGGTSFIVVLPETIVDTGPVIGVGYIASALALAVRVEWLRSKHRAPNGPAMFGWLGVNTIRFFIGRAYIPFHDPWITGLVWSSRVFAAAYALLFACLAWRSAQIGLL